MKYEIERWSERLEADVQILSDGKTCWVNESTDGGCIGRWSPTGIDIHRTTSAQMRGGKQCLACKPYGSWLRFLELMETHYGVEIPRYLIDERYR